jgi:hypothetical protein
MNTATELGRVRDVAERTGGKQGREGRRKVVVKKL